MTTRAPQFPGAPVVRREARDKVTGTARYAADRAPAGCLYAWTVPATVAAGRVTAVRAVDALAVPGVHSVLTHDNAPELQEPDDPILAVLQDDRVPHHGWPIALVIAESLEAARTGAGELHVEYERDAHDVTLTDDHPGLYTPEEANGGHPAVRVRGDVERALAGASVQIDATYRMAALHNHPMEPHAATAVWEDGHLTVHDSSQGATKVRDSLARAFGLDPDRITVVSEHVGGGFGSKGTTRPQGVLAAMAARHTGRPVKLVLPEPSWRRSSATGPPRSSGSGSARTWTGCSPPSATRSSPRPPPSRSSSSRPPCPPASCTPRRTAGPRTG